MKNNKTYKIIAISLILILTQISTSSALDLSFNKNIFDFNINSFLYTGKEKDSTGLYYYGARYYDTDLMTFITPDQNIPNLYNPQDLNRYTYVRNNPYKYVDPDGKVPIDVFVDLAFIAYGAYQLANDPSLENLGSLGLDIGFAFLPYVPNVKRIKEGVKALDKASDAMKGGEKISDVTKFQESVQRGRESEAFALSKEGIPKNTQAFQVDVPGKGTVTTIPDSRGLHGGQVIEIKDRKYVSMTNQLRAESNLARQQGTTAKLITGTYTKVSDSVKRTFNIIRRSFLGPKKGK